MLLVRVVKASFTASDAVKEAFTPLRAPTKPVEDLPFAIAAEEMLADIVAAEDPEVMTELYETPAVCRPGAAGPYDADGVGARHSRVCEATAWLSDDYAAEALSTRLAGKDPSAIQRAPVRVPATRARVSAAHVSMTASCARVPAVPVRVSGAALRPRMPAAHARTAPPGEQANRRTGEPDKTERRAPDRIA